MLNDIDFKPLYATGQEEPSDFFIDGLCNSNYFDFGLGYFRSTGFKSLAIGFATFIQNGGKMRFIINDSLIEKDKNAIIQGQAQEISDKEYEEILIKDLKELSKTLSKRDEHFFNCLSWLISSNRLEIKVAVPKKNKVGIVHHKFGIFTDADNDKVIFNGSVNFSEFALKRNVESLICDCSWEAQGKAKLRIDNIFELFEKTWNEKSEVVRIIPVEEVKVVIQTWFPRKKIKELIEEEESLLKQEIQNSKKASQDKRESTVLTNAPQSDEHNLLNKDETAPKLKSLRDYQSKAIANWKANNYTGILEMATGTGKTFTALTAIKDLLLQKKRLVVIISCPFIHLAEQWQDEASNINIESILIGESRELWEDRAARQVQLFKRNKINFVLLITTNASFKSEVFQKIIHPNLHETLLIIDEVHYAGASSIRKLLPQDCKYRLGLSATPERHGDDEGTSALFEYFDKVVFSFPIEKAIGKYLTPYYYYPVCIELTENEFDEYCNLTKQIIMLAGKRDELNTTKREKLAIRRARVQNNSINKVKWLENNISSLPLDYSLFYAGDQIFADIKYLLGKKLKMSLHEFTSKQSRSERKKLLVDFAKQKIKSLIAMKCLDEGVDVPPTKVAYFLASSSNPREFVQRRGRVLRLSEGKKYATIYDLISIPPKRFIEQGRKGRDYYATKAAFIKEYKRVKEFAGMAINQFEAVNELFAMANKLDLLDN